MLIIVVWNGINVVLRVKKHLATQLEKPTEA